MATKIEWCEETWNPIVGCSKVSPGCDHCYAERMAFRLSKMGVYPYTEVISDGRKWNGTALISVEQLLKPGKWKTARKIFVCSMGDLFHESVSFSDILEVLFVMNKCPQHTFLLLTKRPERMREFFTEWVSNPFFEPLPNVWLGVTAENQMRANERIPVLLQIPAAKRFVSIEPMLTAIDFYDIQMGNEFYNTLKGFGDISGSNGISGGPKLDWVICGGESGTGARPMHPEWVRSLRDQCQAAGTPFFFKQWGEYVDLKHMESFSLDMEGIRYTKTVPYADGSGPAFKVGKKAAGSLLDGKAYKEYPK